MIAATASMRICFSFVCVQYRFSIASTTLAMPEIQIKGAVTRSVCLAMSSRQLGTNDAAFGLREEIPSPGHGFQGRRA